MPLRSGDRGSKQETFFRFGAVGVVNTLAGLAVIFMSKWFFGFSDALANIIGYLCGLAISFTLNRTWTFRDSGALATSLARFLLVFLIAYLFNLVTVLLAIHALRLNSYLAHAIGVVPYTLVLFLGSHYFAFRARSAGRS